MTYLKTLSIIHIALAAGQLIFAVGVLVYLKDTIQHLFWLTDVFTLVVPAVAFVGFSVGNLLFKRFVDATLQMQTLTDKLNGYRTALIIRFALIEGPFIFAILAFIFSTNAFCLLTAALLFLYFITLRPSKEKLIRDLKLDYRLLSDLEKHV